MNNDSDEEEKPEEPLPENKKRYSDMKNEHYKEVVKICHQVLQKAKLDKDAAVEIVSKCKECTPLKNTGDGEWQCIIGTHFGASLTFDTNCLSLIDFPEFRKSVMLFRSG